MADRYQIDFGDNIESTTRVPSDESCSSDFRAATLTITSRQLPLYNETGIFGSVCKHDIPLEFTNMVLSGERYKYPLAVVKALTEKFGFNINIMYDIGCRFKPALFAKFPELERAGSQVVVGVFHSYAHSMSCQVKNNPRYLKGAGLLDGEGLERLWSYLGEFVSITRQKVQKGASLRYHMH
ncbi:hypothetical protein BJV82DRAFT_526155 [Fennellomyces sp. T-0311]|nr:hypothetical protein BJV82DRAFT_526155 [Fennellomyces sp. T-0311]